MKNGRFEFSIFIPTLLLAIISLSLVLSLSPDLFSSQAIFFLIGFFFFFFFSKVDWQFLKTLSWPIYFFSIFLLILTFFGPKVRGATRSIEFFSFRVQPVEFIKPLLALSLARFVSSSSLKNFKKVLFFFCFLLPPSGLIFLQPDLGNMIIILGFGLGIILAGNLNFRLIILFVLGGVILAPFGFTLLKEYQKERLLAFLNPSFDPQGAGYNSLQAIIAVGSGKLFGRGLGRGTQSHLKFLPEYHTDFIFASLCEELGFLGGGLVLGCYFFLLLQILKAASNNQGSFPLFFTIGIFTQLLLQIFINVGMNLGLVPITGVTLPLLSYGGSSIISTLIGLGMIASLKRQKRPKMLVIA